MTLPSIRARTQRAAGRAENALLHLLKIRTTPTGEPVTAGPPPGSKTKLVVGIAEPETSVPIPPNCYLRVYDPGVLGYVLEDRYGNKITIGGDGGVLALQNWNGSADYDYNATLELPWLDFDGRTIAKVGGATGNGFSYGLFLLDPTAEAAT